MKFPHLTLGDLRAMLAQHEDKPDDMQVRLVMDRTATVGDIDDGSASTYARATSPLNFYQADGVSPDCLALCISDTGLNNGEDTPDHEDEWGDEC